MTLPHFISQKRIFFLFSSGLFVACGAYFIISTYTSNTNPTSTEKSIQWLTPKKKINIQKALDFPFTHIIQRYQKDYGVSLKTALEHERELKRFLIISAENHPDILGMFSPEVDNLWHTFLLFTKEYHKFCYDILGQFMHHVPKIEENNNPFNKSAISEIIST